MTFGQIVRFIGVYGDWMVISYENDPDSPAVLVHRVTAIPHVSVRYWVSNISAVWDEDKQEWKVMP